MPGYNLDIIRDIVGCRDQPLNERVADLWILYECVHRTVGYMEKVEVDEDTLQWHANVNVNTHPASAHRTTSF